MSDLLKSDAGESAPEAPTEQVSGDGVYGEVPARFPPADVLLSPPFLWLSGKKFLAGWFYTRRYARIAAGLPAFLMAVIAVGFLIWLRNASQEKIVARYERAIVAAMKKDDIPKANLLLNGLIALQPGVDRYKYQLAVFTHENGDSGTTRSLMQQLAPLNRAGYPAARTWLAERALAGDPEFPMPIDEVAQQLRLAVEENPVSIEAHSLLAEYYTRTDQLRLAEQHLYEAAELDASMYLPLAKVQLNLERDRAQILDFIDRAKAEFQRTLSEDPDNTPPRIRWAEACALKGEYAEAESVLREAPDFGSNEELVRALSQLHSGHALTLLRESALNADRAASLLVLALNTDSANTQAVVSLSQTRSEGRLLTPESLKKPTEYWQSQVAESPDDIRARLMLVELLAVSGRLDEAISHLELLERDVQAIRPALARLYSLADRQEDADRLAESVLEEMKQSETTENASLIARAQLLLQIGHLEQARKLLEGGFDIIPQKSLTSARTIYGRVLLALYDEKKGASAENADDEALELLVLAARQPQSAELTIARLAELSVSDSPVASKAENALSNILTQTRFAPTIYVMAGTYALEAGRHRMARNYLETAKRLAPENGLVLNNLAIALLRGVDPDPARALELVQSALAQNPGNLDMVSTRAEAYVALRRWEEAERDLQQCLLGRPRSVVVRELAVRTYRRLGRDIEADAQQKILEALQNEATAGS